MVVPALAALFAGSFELLVLFFEAGCYCGPVVEADFGYDLGEEAVLLNWGEGTFVVQFLRMREI